MNRQKELSEKTQALLIKHVKTVDIDLIPTVFLFDVYNLYPTRQIRQKRLVATYEMKNN